MKERLECKLLMWGWETWSVLVIREDPELWFDLQIQMFRWWQGLGNRTLLHHCQVRWDAMMAPWI